MFRAISVAFTLALATPAAAQDVATMDAYVSAEEEAGSFMGAVLVAKDGEILLDQGYGAADLAWGIPNGGDVKYRIGSVTKQFTAASILLLEERGKLSLDAPIATYLDDTPPAWAAITVQQLLNHNSGIPNFTAREDFSTFAKLPVTRRSVIALFRDEPLDFAPGSEYSYSNSGYYLLSAIIEDVSGQPYGNFVQDNIFDPLGMVDSGLADNTSIVARHATGYAPSGEGPQRAGYANLDIPQGAGAIYSTTRDLLKWQRGLFGGEILSPASLAKYVTPALDNYALGVGVRKNAAGTTYLHSGGIEGFNSWLGYDPERKVTVAVLANLNGPAASEIGAGLMGLAQGGELTIPMTREAAQVDAAELAQYEGIYALAPTFKIRVFVEDGRLRAQATGQPAFDLFAQAGEADFFFLKVIDAQVRFNRGADGAVKSLTLYQNGQETLGARE